MNRIEPDDFDACLSDLRDMRHELKRAKSEEHKDEIIYRMQMIAFKHPDLCWLLRGEKIILDGIPFWEKDD